MPKNKDRLFMLVEIADNEPARALVENLMNEMDGKVVDAISAEPEVLVIEGMPTIAWIDNLYNSPEG